MMISVIITLIFLSDRLTKFLASKFLSLNQTIPLIKGVFHLTLVHNRGAAFGIFRNQLWLFILSAVFAAVLIIMELRESKGRKPFIYTLALGLVLAGALGNLIDRVFLGFVVDFLDFRVWPVFNIADSSITIGAVLLAYSILKIKN